MIFPCEAAFVHILTGIVGRIAIEKRVRPVIMFNQNFEVLILYDGVGKAFAELFNKNKQLVQIHQLMR